MSSGRTPALPAALRIWPVISSSPALEIGCGVSASGSKKIGSSGPVSRPNFSRNFRSCSWIACCASAFSGTAFDLPFLRPLKYAICNDRLVYTPSDIVLVRTRHVTQLGGFSRYKDGTRSTCSLAFLKGSYGTCRSDRCPVSSFVCNRLTPFTAVTRVQIPSGTPNIFRDLERKSPFVVGTKGNSTTGKICRPAVPELHFPRFDGFFVGTKRHNLTPQLRTPLRERETSELRHSELRVFVP